MFASCCRVAALAAAVALVSSTPVWAANGDDAPMMPLYKRSTAPIDDRVADLMSRMTLEDKLEELR